MKLEQSFSASEKQHGAACTPETTGPTGISGSYCATCKICIAGNGLAEHVANGHR